MKTTWFEYSQNNSGGRFDGDFGVSVFIEAADAEHADTRAEKIGIYFNGCAAGQDCPCCGDRWYPADKWNEVRDLHDALFEGEYSAVKRGQMWRCPPTILPMSADKLIRITGPQDMPKPQGE